MRKQRILLAVLLACLTLPIPAMTKQRAAAFQKPQPRADLPVTSTVSDYADVTDSTGTSQRIWMQVRSDAAGVYTNNSDVESIIQGVSGDWYLTDLTSARHVFLDFSKPIPGTGPNGGPPTSPFSSALIGARLVSKCHLYNNDMFTIPVGATVNCPLGILFSVSGNDYLLQMNPVAGEYVFPETDYVNVTCIGAGANSQCNNWTIAPNAFRGGCVTPDCAGSVKQNVARLNKMVPIKGRSGSVTPVNQGDFYVAFSISITNP
jgi:hypothetical protein